MADGNFPLAAGLDSCSDVECHADFTRFPQHEFEIPFAADKS